MHDDELYEKQDRAEKLTERWEMYDDDIYIPEKHRSKKRPDIPSQYSGSVAGTDGSGDFIIAAALIAALIGILIGGSM